MVRPVRGSEIAINSNEKKKDLLSSLLRHSMFCMKQLLETWTALLFWHLLLTKLKICFPYENAFMFGFIQIVHPQSYWEVHICRKFSYFESAQGSAALTRNDPIQIQILREYRSRLRRADPSRPHQWLSRVQRREDQARCLRHRPRNQSQERREEEPGHSACRMCAAMWATATIPPRLTKRWIITG